MTDHNLIDGALGIARRVPETAYTAYRPAIRDAWLINSEHLLPPFRQYAISLAEIADGLRWSIMLVAVLPREDGQLAAVDDASDVVGYAPPLIATEQRGSIDALRDLCRTVAYDIVHGNITIGMSDTAWRLYLGANLLRLQGQVVP